MTITRDGVEYVEFTDHVTGDRYLFNVTFFLSTYECTWGRGCKGCDNTPNNGCCNIGAHVVDETEQDYVQQYIDRLTPDQWANYGRDVWEVTEAGEIKTTRIDGVCVMNNPDHHDTPGCALHVGAIANGEDFHDWKPDACWMYPIRTSVIDFDNDVYLVGPVYRNEQWSHAHTGWWCIDDEANYLGQTRAFMFFEDELIRMTSENIYDQFAAYCSARLVSGKITKDYGKAIGGRNGRVASVPVTLIRK